MSEISYVVDVARYVRLPYESIRVDWTHGVTHLLPVDITSLARLKSGIECTEFEYLQWDTLHAALAAWQGSLRRLERSACSSGELRRYLKQRKFSQHAIDSAIERATEQGMLNDQAFAGRLAERKFHQQGKGRSRIKMELQQKGLTSNQIREATSFINDEDEYVVAFDWAHKRWPKTKGEGQDKAMRMARQLQQRGYSHSVIRKVLGELRVNLDNYET